MKSFFSLILIILLFGCQDDPDESYPIEPQIQFSKIDYGVGLPTSYDTLSLTFSFTDGDEDFGLNYDSPQDLLPPYQEGFFFLKTTGERITSDKLLNNEIPAGELIKYSDRSNPPFDSLPALSSCNDYWYYDLSAEAFYFQRNENHYNFFVKFYYQDNNGDFVELDLRDQFCLTFDARIPPRKGQVGPFNITMANSRKGKITYSMVSAGFVTLFGDKKMKLEFSIQDRALHRSNIIETPTFLLSEI
jgi:hypothetical protein